MCVLTYVPKGVEGVIVTHNRDEHQLRPEAVAPQVYQIEGESVCFPKDPLGGGTWFALHKDWLCCLLNGGFEKHISAGNYQRSRGTVILDFFKYKDSTSFAEGFDARGLEPFTLVLIALSPRQVLEFVWDGKTLHQKTRDADESHIWSSSTLYDRTVKQGREEMFRVFIEKNQAAEDLINLHKTQIDNDLKKSLFVNIEDRIKTVAITQAYSESDGMRLQYLRF
jgi:Transport and Golgi organisation 2